MLLDPFCAKPIDVSSLLMTFFFFSILNIFQINISYDLRKGAYVHLLEVSYHARHAFHHVNYGSGKSILYVEPPMIYEADPLFSYVEQSVNYEIGPFCMSNNSCIKQNT